MKTIKSQKVMKMRPEFHYEIDIQWDPDDEVYVALVPELKGCSSHGATSDEALDNAKDAIASYVQSLKDRGLEVPVPLSDRPYSGEFMLRIDPVLHRDLAMKARRERVSLTQLIARTLKEKH